jgi:hypothetical protein
MFIGHFAAAFGAKKLAPEVSLGMLFFACQLADLLWPNLVLLGLERFAIDPGNTALTPLAFESYPYSHSFAAHRRMGLLDRPAPARARRAAAAPPLSTKGRMRLVENWTQSNVSACMDSSSFASALRLSEGRLLTCIRS